MLSIDDLKYELEDRYHTMQHRVDDLRREAERRLRSAEVDPEQTHQWQERSMHALRRSVDKAEESVQQQLQATNADWQEAGGHAEDALDELGACLSTAWEGLNRCRVHQGGCSGV